MVDPISNLIWRAPTPISDDRLNRPAIVAAAIRVADSRGMNGLTMAAVARELGDYTAMALYRYVHSKDGLIDLMLDEVLSEVPLPAADANWRTSMHDLAMQAWALTRRHPWYARLVPTRPPLGPNNLRRTEAVLRVLTAAGLHTGDALSYLALLDRHVYSAAVAATEESEMLSRLGLTGEDDFGAAIVTIRKAMVSDLEYPLLANWMSEPHTSTWDDQLDRGLGFILDGIGGRIAIADGSGSFR